MFDNMADLDLGSNAEISEKPSRGICESRSSYTALHYAVASGNLDTVSVLLDGKTNMEAKTRLGHTALHLALLKNYTDIAQLLLSRGADVTARGRFNRTVLHLAAGLGSLDLFILFLNLNCDVNARDDFQLLPIHLAIWYGHDHIVKLLAGFVDIDDIELLRVACKRGHVGVISQLLQLVSNVGRKDENGDSLLHLTIQHGHQDAADYLILHGADLHSPNKNGQTPAALAQAIFPKNYWKPQRQSRKKTSQSKINAT